MTTSTADVKKRLAQLADEITEAEEMAAAATPAPTLSVGEVVHKGDSETPIPMAVSSMSDAGYVMVYDTKTGDPSIINRNMLPAQLRKKREDGTPVFTVRDPGFRPALGTHKCLLHPESKMRKTADTLGLPTCRKQTLVSEYAVRSHMQKRHPAEFAALEDHRLSIERARDRAQRDQLLAAVTGGKPEPTAVAAALAVTETPAEPVEEGKRSRRRLG